MEDFEFETNPAEFDVPSKWCRRYLAFRATPTLQQKTLADGSLVQYESILREWANWIQDKDYTLDEAEFKHFVEYIRYCIELGRRTGTVMNRVSIGKEFYKYLIVYEDIQPNISPIHIGTIKREAVDNLTPSDLDRSALSKKEVEKLFEALETERNRLMAIVGVETGFRNSDVLGIRLQDIDLESDIPKIEAHNPKYGTPYTVPISEDLALTLQIWINQGRTEYVGNIETGYLFPSESDKMISSTSHLGEIIRSAAERAGVQSILGKTEYETKYMKSDKIEKTWYEVMPHALRHTFITILEKEGVPLEYRQLLAGHENPETTQRYSHGKQHILKQAQGRINVDY